jgi:ribonuclease HII
MAALRIVEGVTGNLFVDETRDLLSFEKRIRRLGYSSIAGIDEAGRGALAGPVVAAAVILPLDGDFAGIDDSKKLTPCLRDVLFDKITEQAVAVGIGIGDHLLVDRINVLQATLYAMELAVQNLSIPADFLLIDGISAPTINLPCKTIKKGDSASLSIAAASIIAKVTRDRMMFQLAGSYPEYGFEMHKGYGAPAHLAAIAAVGPCQIHRKTFRGVKEFVGSKE